MLDDDVMTQGGFSQRTQLPHAQDRTTLRPGRISHGSREGVESPLIGAEQCAEMLGCTTLQIEELARNGELPGLKIGRSWRFVRADLLVYLAEKARAEAEQRRSRRHSTKGQLPPVTPQRRVAPPLPTVAQS